MRLSQKHHADGGSDRCRAWNASRNWPTLFQQGSGSLSLRSACGLRHGSPVAAYRRTGKELYAAHANTTAMRGVGTPPEGPIYGGQPEARRDD